MASSTASARKHSHAAPLSQYRVWLDRGIFILSLLGLLVVAHLGLQSARGFEGGCSGFDPNALSAGPSGCAEAFDSTYATFLGLSNVIWGLAFYFTVAALSYAIAVAPPEKILSLKKIRGAILGVGFVYALYLAFILLTGRSGGLCGLCLTSHVITFLMFALFVFDFNSKSSPSRK